MSTATATSKEGIFYSSQDLSRSCDDYVNYCATKLFTAQLCKQVSEVACGPGGLWSCRLTQKLHTIAEPQYFREIHSARSGKNHSANSTKKPQLLNGKRGEGAP